MSPESVCWPKLDKHIEDLVRSCLSCQRNQDCPAVAKLQLWAWPVKPWQRIHIDFAVPSLGKMFSLWMCTLNGPRSLRCPQQHPLLSSVCCIICSPPTAYHVNLFRTMVRSFALRSLPSVVHLTTLLQMAWWNDL